jgi:hypothetical protein
MSEKNVIVCDQCGKECKPVNFLSILPPTSERVCVHNERQEWGFSRIDFCSLECAKEFFADKFYKGPTGGMNGSL